MKQNGQSSFSSPTSDLEKFGRERPHKILQGRTCALTTFAPEMFEMLDELKVAAAHNITILLTGETGVGKTFLARLIHEISPRHADRFMTVPCGALPLNLIESEMFGYVKGAFTGADRAKEGKFSAAGRGTLLLDEIDVLSPEQQAKLLRVIEAGEFEPVGSNETQVSESRIIAASNFDLESLMDSGTFRRDLYYRLNVLNFRVPPLRERPFDIEYLAHQFVQEHSREHAVQIHEIEAKFLGVLRSYAWPGNVRELENVIRRSVLYCRDGVLRVQQLPSSLRDAARSSSRVRVGGAGHSTLGQRVDFLEQRIITDSLRRNNQRRQVTAKELGISRVTLYNKMKKFGMLTVAAPIDAGEAMVDEPLARESLAGEIC